MSSTAWLNDERGEGSVITAALLLPVMALFLGGLIAAHELLETRSAVRAVAIESARVLAAGSARAAAIDDAEQLAASLAAGYGLDPWSISTDVPLGFDRGAAFSVTVGATIQLSLLVLPAATVQVEYTHHEHLARHRSRSALPPSHGPRAPALAAGALSG